MGPPKRRRAVVVMAGVRNNEDIRYNTNTMYDKTKSKRPEWRIVERRVNGDAGVIVSELPLPVPRYSFRVGTAKFDDEKQEMYVTPYLTVFNVDDACDLLREVSDKYIEKREKMKDELDAQRAHWETKE